MADPRKRSVWPVAVLATLLLYPLSVGPAAVVLRRVDVGPHFVDRYVRPFYAPIRWGAEHSETFRNVVDVYVTFCFRICDR